MTPVPSSPRSEALELVATTRGDIRILDLMDWETGRGGMHTGLSVRQLYVVRKLGFLWGINSLLYDIRNQCIASVPKSET